MKKIPTLFQREFENHNVVSIRPEVKEGLEWVLAGEGIATEKADGACTAVIDGVFYKRYDAKKDKHGNLKLPPEGAIPCDKPDPITGHWPHWVKVSETEPADRWFIEAYHNTLKDNEKLPDGTYEAIGPHFQSNPYRLDKDTLVRHGSKEIDLIDRSFDGIREFLGQHRMEGIVFWKDGEPRCKIKRRDFGFKWPCIEKDIENYIAQNNRKLIERFPFLLPGYGRNEDGSISSDFDYSFTELDSMPAGWRKAFGEKMCEEIKEALLSSSSTETERERALREYRILEIKEKYGQLRWYDSGSVNDIIDKYSRLSETICVRCGKPATRWSTHWISPYCDDCGPKYERYVPVTAE